MSLTKQEKEELKILQHLLRQGENNIYNTKIELKRLIKLFNKDKKRVKEIMNKQ